MKIIILFLAFLLNGCAVYLVKCDCPEKTTAEESPYFNWDYKWGKDDMPIMQRCREYSDSLNQEIRVQLGD